MYARARRGFTLTEILVVIGIMALVGALSASAFLTIRDRQALRVATQDVYGALIDARERTLASSGDTVHGVHFSASEIVRFVGTPYDSNGVTNEPIALPATVTASTTLSGGAVDVVFERLTGSAQSTGTILLTDINSGVSYTMTVHASGLIEL